MRFQRGQSPASQHRYENIVVARFREFGSNNAYAIMHVIGHSSRDGLRWLQVANPPTASGPFEDDGTVAWFSFPDDVASRNEIWRFQVVQQPYSKGDDAPRWRVVDELSPLVGVLNQQELSEAELRAALSGPGLALAIPPLPRMLIPIPDEKQLSIGPVTLDEGEPGRWRIPGDVLARPLPVVRGELSATLLTIDDHEQIVIAPLVRTVVAQSVFRDWRPREVFLADILSRLKSTHQPDHDALQTAVQTIEQAMATLPNDVALTSDQQSRLLQMIERSELHETHRIELLESIATSSTMAHLVEQRIEGELASVRERKLREIETELAEQRRKLADEIAEQSLRLDQLAAERQRLVDQTHAALAELKETSETVQRERLEAVKSLADVTSIRQRLDKEFVQFEGDLRKRASAISDDALRQLRDRAAQATDNVSHSVAPIRTLTHNTNVTTKWEAISDPFPEQASEPLPEVLAQAVESLMTAARRRGVSEVAAWRTVSALLSGTIPSIVGHRAIPLLEVIADTFCGGDLLVIPASPTMLEPADLLGRPGRDQQPFVPANPLLDALLTADQRSHPCLIVIEGANRAPIESYLLPILDLAAAPKRRSYPLAHPRAFPEGDPYANAATLCWPSGVLLALTLIDAKTTIPLPAELWRRSVLVVEHEGQTSRKRTAARLNRTSAASCEHWSAWRRDAGDGDESLSDLLDIDYEVRGLDDSIREHGERFGRALLATQPNNSDYDERLALLSTILGPWYVEQQSLESYQRLATELDAELLDLPMIQQLIGRTLS